MILRTPRLRPISVGARSSKDDYPIAVDQLAALLMGEVAASRRSFDWLNDNCGT